MAKITRTVEINAPVNKVFDYFVEPTHLLEFWPSMIEVKDVKQTPKHIGDHYHWVYKMANMRFEGDSETTDYVANERVMVKNTGGIPSTFKWSFKGTNGHTVLTMEAEYTVPASLLGKLAEPFLIRLNEHEADTVIANLKDRMEI